MTYKLVHGMYVSWIACLQYFCITIVSNEGVADITDDNLNEEPDFNEPEDDYFEPEDDYIEPEDDYIDLEDDYIELEDYYISDDDETKQIIVRGILIILNCIFGNAMVMI
jgi:hypothetical protein